MIHQGSFIAQNVQYGATKDGAKVQRASPEEASGRSLNAGATQFIVCQLVKLVVTEIADPVGMRFAALWQAHPFAALRWCSTMIIPDAVVEHP